MKHIFLPILLLALLLPTTAMAYDFEVGGIYYEINGSEATVAQSPSYSYRGDVVIPSSVAYQGTTYSVTAIGNKAFYGCTGMTSISMPNTIKSIGETVFYCCEQLTSVTIPNSVVTIGYRAFYYTPRLTSVVIGNSVTTIGNQAFLYCESLENLTLGNSVSTIGEYAFGSNKSLKSVAIPASVTTIGRLAFQACTGLERVDITDLTAWCSIAIAGVDANPLYYAKHLYLNGSEVTNLVFPNTLTEIKSYTFYGCTGLTRVTIPTSVTKISNFAFCECHNITSVSIPNTVETIGMYAFSECNSLSSIMIPASVTSIGSGTFDGTTAMSRMVVASGNPVYDSRNNCNAIIETATNKLVYGCKTTVIPNTVTTIGELAFSCCYGLTSITIPSTVTAIEDQAFIGCTSLSSIYIPSSVESIGLATFEMCYDLASITVASDNPVYDSRDNCNAIIVTASNVLLQGCKTTVIPSTVTAIGRYSFMQCKHLSVMDIPDGVTYIGQDAFENCEELRSVYIPATVTEIGSWAFYGCLSLNEVYCDIPDPSAISMGSHVFNKYGENGYDFTGRVLHVPVGTVEAYQADTRWSDFFEFIVENVMYGDVDGDGQISIGDITDLIDMLLNGDPVVTEHPAADVDGDGNIGIGDVTELIDRVLNTL